MCGLAATLDKTGHGVDRDALLRVRDRMAPRGPDGLGCWVAEDGRVGLAHRRLSIIDLSDAGAQPMAGADGRLRVVFNGEIYNYRALRADLEARGHAFRSHSDTEVLLALYREHEADLVHHLRGMFAFALWDAEKGGLLLARDPYGIKPLYYSDDARALRVASQVKALLAGGDVDTAPDPAGHVGFFLWGHVPEPHTLYRGIRALPAGHTAWATPDGRLELHQYASIPAALAAAEQEAAAQAWNGSPLPTRGGGGQGEGDDLDLRLRTALRDSVRAHLTADVPVGLFLSAGLDSATLAALATEEGGRLRTVTLGFEEYAGTPSDEAPLAEALARHYGTDHTTVRVTRSDFEGARDHLLDAMDQPSIDGVNTYFVARAAAQAGLKVAVSGVGGDELFGGYGSFRQIPRLVGALGPIPGLAPLGRGFRLVAAPVLKRFTSPKAAGLFEYGGDYGGAYLLRRGLHMPWELPTVLDADLVREGWAALQPRLRVAETAAGIRSPRLRVSALESCWYLRNQLLRDTDWASMAHSLEVRTPLVDWTLLQRLAPMLAARPDLDKQALAATARPALPEAVRNRPKTGFQVPVRDWLLAGQEDSAVRGLRGWARFVYRARSADRYSADVPRALQVA